MTLSAYETVAGVGIIAIAVVLVVRGGSFSGSWSSGKSRATLHLKAGVQVSRGQGNTLARIPKNDGIAGDCRSVGKESE